jgi:hypothetical protein
MAKQKEDFSDLVAAREAHRNAEVEFHIAKMRKEAVEEQCLQALSKLHSTGKHFVELMDKHGLKAVYE